MSLGLLVYKYDFEIEDTPWHQDEINNCSIYVSVIKNKLRCQIHSMEFLHSFLVYC